MTIGISFLSAKHVVDAVVQWLEIDVAPLLSILVRSYNLIKMISHKSRSIEKD